MVYLIDLSDYRNKNHILTALIRIWLPTKDSTIHIKYKLERCAIVFQSYLFSDCFYYFWSYCQKWGRQIISYFLFKWKQSVWPQASKTKAFTNAEIWQLYKRDITKPLHQIVSYRWQREHILFKIKTVCTTSISAEGNTCTFASQGFSSYHFFLFCISLRMHSFCWGFHGYQSLEVFILAQAATVSLCLSLWMQVLVLPIL